MNTLSFRLALAVLLTAFGIGSAEASRISVNEQAESGGTIINDGSGDDPVERQFDRISRPSWRISA